MCLCCGAGRKARQVRDAFSSTISKPLAPPHSVARRELKEGRWAFLFTGWKTEPAEAPDGEPMVVDVEPIILQAAKHCLSPWQPTWHIIEPADAPLGEPDATDRRKYTKVMGTTVRQRDVPLGANLGILHFVVGLCSCKSQLVNQGSCN